MSVTAAMTASVPPAQRPHNTATQGCANDQCHTHLGKMMNKTQDNLLGEQGVHLSHQRVLQATDDVRTVPVGKAAVKQVQGSSIEPRGDAGRRVEKRVIARSGAPRQEPR